MSDQVVQWSRLQRTSPYCGLLLGKYLALSTLRGTFWIEEMEWQVACCCSWFHLTPWTKATFSIAEMFFSLQIAEVDWQGGGQVLHHRVLRQSQQDVLEYPLANLYRLVTVGVFCSSNTNSYATSFNGRFCWLWWSASNLTLSHSQWWARRVHEWAVPIFHFIHLDLVTREFFLLCGRSPTW